MTFVTAQIDFCVSKRFFLLLSVHIALLSVWHMNKLCLIVFKSVSVYLSV